MIPHNNVQYFLAMRHGPALVLLNPCNAHDHHQLESFVCYAYPLSTDLVDVRGPHGPCHDSFFEHTVWPDR